MLLKPRVAIVIVAWNQLDATLACLKTVYAQSYDSFEVVLVDNGSDAGFQEKIRAQYPQVTLLGSRTNLGFSGGNNIGIRYALSQSFDFVFLLNNDTLLDSGCLQTLVNGLDGAKQDVAAVAAKIYYAHDRSRIWTVGCNFRPWLRELNDVGKDSVDEGQWSQSRQVEFVPFCGVLFKREVFGSTGLLDEGYFLYYEDMDYCQRLLAEGRKIKFEPNAIIWHAVSASSGGNQSTAALYWLAKSSGRYFRTYGRGWRMILILPYRLASALRKTGTLLLASNFQEIKSYWRGLKDGWLTP